MQFREYRQINLIYFTNLKKGNNHEIRIEKNCTAQAVAIALCASAVTTAHAAPAFITDGAGTSATIADAGYFQPGGIGLSYLGKEFVNWDTLASNYSLNANGVSVGIADEVAGSNPFGASIIFGGANVALAASFGGGWSFVETVSIPTPGHLAVQVQLTNNTGADDTSVQWGVGFDPDQGRAVGTGNGPVDPALMLATAQVPGSYGFSDSSINLAYDLGAIANHNSVTLGYEYIAAVPEPETYSILLIEMGLIGFSVCRRTEVAV